MCTVWAALFLFLSLSVSVPAFPPSSSSSFAFFLYLPLTLASSLSASSLFFLPRVVPPVFPDPPSVPFSVSPPFPLSFSHTHTHIPRVSPSLSVSPLPRPFSLVISSSFARSRFFSRFFHRPPIFPLPCVGLPSFFCPPSSSASSSPAAPLPDSLYLSPALPSSLYIPPPPP